MLTRGRPCVLQVSVACAYEIEKNGSSQGPMVDAGDDDDPGERSLGIGKDGDNDTAMAMNAQRAGVACDLPNPRHNSLAASACETPDGRDSGTGRQNAAGTLSVSTGAPQRHDSAESLEAEQPAESKEPNPRRHPV